MRLGQEIGGQSPSWWTVASARRSLGGPKRGSKGNVGGVHWLFAPPLPIMRDTSYVLPVCMDEISIFYISKSSFHRCYQMVTIVLEIALGCSSRHAISQRRRYTTPPRNTKKKTEEEDRNNHRKKNGKLYETQPRRTSQSHCLYSTSFFCLKLALCPARGRQVGSRWRGAGGKCAFVARRARQIRRPAGCPHPHPPPPLCSR